MHTPGDVLLGFKSTVLAYLMLTVSNHFKSAVLDS